MKKTYLRMIALILIGLIIILPVSFADSIAITDVTVSGITDTSAEITWNTAIAADSRVNYGKTAPLSEYLVDYGLENEHYLKLTELDESSQYLFEVVSRSDFENEETDNNDGAYYQFTTKADLPPIIEVDIPPYYNKATSIDLNIKTDPDSLVDVSVNGGTTDRQKGYATEEGDRPMTIDLDIGYNKINIISEDPAGNTNEAEYEMIVDLTAPVIELEEIPALTTDEKIIVKGNVSENVNLKISLKYQNPNAKPPAKITGLRNLTVTDNDVELEWDASTHENFKEYLIYRDGKRIAKRTPNNFVDQVNTSTSYTYQVSAIDQDYNEGEKSDSLTITTSSGNTNITVPVQEVELDNENIQEIVIETDDKFSEEFEMDEDGFYLLRLEAYDIANNSEIIEKNIYLDTKPPEITDTTPENGAQIFEQFADEVEITGKTDPFAKVYLYVKRTPLGEFNNTVDVYGIPDKIQHLDEAHLAADSSHDTRADYETVADENGFFKFEMVDITSSIVLGYAVRQVDYEELQRQIHFDPRTQVMGSDLLIIATDPFGRRGAEKVQYRIQTCWGGEKVWDATPLLRYQSPAFISTERLAEGTETLYFYFNFTYWGDEEYGNPVIQSVDIQRACDDYIIDDPEYYHSCQVMRDAPQVKVIGGRTAYVIYRLKRYEQMDNWTEDNWAGFYKALKSNEMLFPLKFIVRYTSQNQTGTSVRKVQTFCDSVGYYVDMSRIDPRKVLPDWLMYDFVDTLDDVINTTTEWMQRLDKILEYAALGCMVSYFTMFLMKITRNFQCKIAALQKLDKIIGGVSGVNPNARCKQCIEQFDGVTDAKKIEGLGTKDLSDTCLKECYPSCYSGWQLESSWYNLYRWSCDRLFGHSAPARWTEKKDSNELLKKARMATQCTNDQSTQGRPLKTVNCRTIEKSYPGTAGRFRVNDKCVELYGERNTKALYQIPNTAKEGDVYELSKIVGPATVQYKYAIKQNENSYLTHQPETCAELCGLTKGQTLGQNTVTIDNKQLLVKEAGKDGDDKAAVCATPVECKSFVEKSYPKGKDKKGKPISFKVETTETKGYTKDCFYQADTVAAQTKLPTTKILSDVDVISGDPKKRMECCCLNSGKDTGTQYYKPEDVESKTTPNQPFETAKHATSWEDMVWSYRYYTIKWKSPKSGISSSTTTKKNIPNPVRDQYDPKRYIKGRDLTACFGQNHWLSSKETTLALNPARDHWATLQCADISGIYNRLAFIKNLATMFKTCLIQVRTTGKADSGVCKELFTQYVCSFIWKILVWVRDGCSPFGSLSKMESAGWKSYMVAGVGSLLDSVKQTQTQMSSEYGNANLNQLFGIGEEAVVKKICLAAFGYDWDISVDSFMDAAYAAPYATFVQSVLPGREYLTFDPTTAKSVYEYKSAWMINPGCNFDNYDVYLSCVSRNEMGKYDDIRCDKVGSTQKPDCACAGLNREVTRRLYDGGKLTKNVLEDIDHTMIPSNNRVIMDKYRYDHLKIVIDARNIAKAKGDVNRCFPEGHVEGNNGIFYFPIKDYTPPELVDCYVDAASGVFDCSALARALHPFGQAYISQITLGPKAEVINLQKLGTEQETGVIFYQGDSQVGGTVTYSKDNKMKCLVVKLLDKAKNEITNKAEMHALREGDTGTKTQSFGINRIITADDINTTNLRTDPSFYLHVDLRKPIEQQSAYTPTITTTTAPTCTNVDHSQYDESHIIVNNGKRQSYDIPIYVSQNRRGNICGSPDLPVSKDAPCVCTTAQYLIDNAQPNCPVLKQDGVNVKYDQCVNGKCRKYPKCKGGQASTCICASPNDLNDLTKLTLDQYNCGYTDATQAYYKKPDHVNENEKQDYRYCDLTEYKCKKTGSSIPTAVVGDNTPPTITKITFIFNEETGIMIGPTVNEADYIVPSKTEVTFEVKAQDNTGITKVELTTDGSVKDTATSTQPSIVIGSEQVYKLKWTTPDIDITSMQFGIEIKVTDNSGNLVKWPLDTPDKPGNKYKFKVEKSSS